MLDNGLDAVSVVFPYARFGDVRSGHACVNDLADGCLYGMLSIHAFEVQRQNEQYVTYIRVDMYLSWNRQLKVSEWSLECLGDPECNPAHVIL